MTTAAPAQLQLGAVDLAIGLHGAVFGLLCARSLPGSRARTDAQTLVDQRAFALALGYDDLVHQDELAP